MLLRYGFGRSFFSLLRYDGTRTHILALCGSHVGTFHPFGHYMMGEVGGILTVVFDRKQPVVGMLHAFHD